MIDSRIDLFDRRREAIILKIDKETAGMYIMQVKKKEDREDWQCQEAAGIISCACISIDMLRLSLIHVILVLSYIMYCIVIKNNSVSTDTWRVYLYFPAYITIQQIYRINWSRINPPSGYQNSYHGNIIIIF